LGDSDESGLEKKEKGEVIEAGGSEAAGSSGSGGKKQTLEDYLAENLEVSWRRESKKVRGFTESFVHSQALSNGEMFAITPRSFCPHLAMLKPEDAPDGELQESKKLLDSTILPL
jgi:hypothetical protein